MGIVLSFLTPLVPFSSPLPILPFGRDLFFPFHTGGFFCLATFLDMEGRTGPHGVYRQRGVSGVVHSRRSFDHDFCFRRSFSQVALLNQLCCTYTWAGSYRGHGFAWGEGLQEKGRGDRSLSLERYGVDGGRERESRIDFPEQLATYYRLNQAEDINLLITSLLGHGRG